jgi:hypothetical protein
MRAPKLLLLLAIAAAALGSATIAAAQFASSASASMSVSTATLAPPSGVTASQINCTNNQPPQIRISWTASSSAFTTGYTIERATTSGGPYTTIGTVSSATTSYTDPSTTLLYSTTYYYLAVSTYNSWTTPASEASVTTLSKTCK